MKELNFNSVGGSGTQSSSSLTTRCAKCVSIMYNLRCAAVPSLLVLDFRVVGVLFLFKNIFWYARRERGCLNCCLKMALPTGFSNVLCFDFDTSLVNS